MYTLLVGAAFGILLGLLTSRHRSWGDKTVAAGMVGVIGIVPAFLVASVIGNLGPWTTTDVGTWKLAAMRTSDETHGTFLFGTGNVKGETIYRVLLLSDDGSMSPWSATANNDTRIVEDDALRNEGKLTIRDYGPDRNWTWANWAIAPAGSVVRSYEYRVPKGSVRTVFDVR